MAQGYRACFPTLKELGIGFVAYSPLGRGFLSGKIRSLDDLAPDDWRRQSPRFQGSNFARNLAVIEAVRAIATAKECTMAQLAMAWVLKTAPGSVALTGATSTDQLDENIRALEVGLTENDLTSIDAVSPKGAFSGDSWPTGSVGARIDNQ